MSNKNNQTLNSLICAEVEHFIELYTENDDVRKLVTLLGRLDITAVPSNTSAANPAVAYLDLVIETHLFPSCCTGNDLKLERHFPVLHASTDVYDINAAILYMFRRGDSQLQQVTAFCYLQHIGGEVDAAREREGVPEGFASVEFAHRVGCTYLVPEDSLIVRRGAMPSQPKRNILVYNVQIPHIAMMKNAYLCFVGNDENSKYALPILTMEERDSMSPIHIIRVIAASVVTVRKLRGELDSAVEHQLTEIKGVLPNLHDVGPAYVTPLGGVKVLP